MGFGTNTEEQKKKLERQFNQPVLLVDQRRAKKNGKVYLLTLTLTKLSQKVTVVQMQL